VPRGHLAPHVLVHIVAARERRQKQHGRERGTM
jgi:hypothetical protein